MVQREVTCTCGARLRLPEGWAGRSGSCPRCKQPIDTSTTADQSTQPPPVKDAASVPRMHRLVRDVGLVCPICQTEIQAHEAVQQCDACHQVHHQECWSEMGGCATYGCSRAPQLQKAQPAAPMSAWGDEKDCPVCGEKIKAIAIKCRFCQTVFDTVDPLSASDMVESAERSASQKSVRLSVIALFVVSILGCAAPLTLFLSLVWFLRKRKEVSRLGPQFLIMGWAALVLSAIYFALMLLMLGVS